MSLAVGVLVGGALQFLVLVPQLVNRGVRSILAYRSRICGNSQRGEGDVPALFRDWKYEINLFVDTFFVNAPRMPRGSLTALYVPADKGDGALVLGGVAISRCDRHFANDRRTGGSQ